jgi:hypothetical protein
MGNRALLFEVFGGKDNRLTGGGSSRSFGTILLLDLSKRRYAKVQRVARGIVSPRKFLLIGAADVETLGCE